MFVPPDVAAKRGLLRYAEAKDRGEKAPYVEIDYILRSTTNEATFDAVSSMMDTWALYDNMGSAPKLVAKSNSE